MAGQLLQLQKRKMALAGSLLTVYLIVHMLSNLSFFSAEGFNHFYAVYNQPWIRWPVLLLVLAALSIHIRVAITLRMKNRQARKQGYKKYDYLRIPTALVSLSITLLFVFIVAHVVQALMLNTADIKQAVMGWFVSIWMTLFYLLGVAILAMHLQHSLVNVMQTLGISSVMYRWTVNAAVILLSLGFSVIPVMSWVMT